MIDGIVRGVGTVVLVWKIRESCLNIRQKAGGMEGGRERERER